MAGDRIVQEKLAQIDKEFGNLVSSRKIDPMLEEVIYLKEIPDALIRSQRRVRGKIVAQIQS